MTDFSTLIFPTPFAAAFEFGGVTLLARTMTFDRFTTHRDAFDVLDLRAHFEFKSTASIGFRLGPIPKSLIVYTVFGALQVHHPCDGHIQARIYVQLPASYREPSLLVKLCGALFREFGIAASETYELHFTDSSNSLSVEQRVSREGFVDAI